jgi:hypothetical protein
VRWEFSFTLELKLVMLDLNWISKTGIKKWNGPSTCSSNGWLAMAAAAAVGWRPTSGWRKPLTGQTKRVDPVKVIHSLQPHSRQFQHFAVLNIWRGTMHFPAIFDACNQATAQRFP